MENEQMYYITYDPETRYINGMVTVENYNKHLTPEQKKQYTQVFIDRSHLYGWGRYWKTARYVDGGVSFPGNWPADQTVQINKLSKDLDDAQVAEQQFQDKINEKVNDNKGLQKIVMNLQQQIADIQVEIQAVKGGDK